MKDQRERVEEERMTESKRKEENRKEERQSDKSVLSTERINTVCIGIIWHPKTPLLSSHSTLSVSMDYQYISQETGLSLIRFIPMSPTKQLLALAS